MKGQKYLTVVLLSAIFLCTAGCISIKDTSGIKAYLQDQGKAEILAVQIKAKNPDKNSAAYQNAERLYNNAAGAGNGWTSGILFDARAKHEVNISIEDYKGSDAGKAISEFLARSDKRLSFDPVTVAAVATFAIDLLDKIKQQNDQWVERAIGTLEREFSRARWTTFENTTADWLDDKYRLSGNGN